jgi:hypothetical protein
VAVSHVWRPWAFGLLELGFAFSFAATPDAATTTWYFEGVVREVVEAPELTPLGVTPGTAFSATISLESSIANDSADPDSTDYPGAILAADFNAGTYHLSIQPNPGLSLLQVFAPIPLLIAQGVRLEPVGSPLENLLVELRAFGIAPGVFALDAMPIDPPSLDDLAPYPELPSGVGTALTISGHHDGIGHYMQAEITRWERVPEPATGALVGLVLLAPHALRLRRRRAA